MNRTCVFGERLSTSINPERPCAGCGHAFKAHRRGFGCTRMEIDDFCRCEEFVVEKVEDVFHMNRRTA
jgi:hypothetical protein